jgi:hypothetical protein
MTARCSHLDQVTVLELPESIEGCAECLASGGTYEIALVIEAR